MTKEDKQVLIKDLCARLPYGVQCKINYTFNNETTFGEDVLAEEDDTLVKIDAQLQSAYFDWLCDWLSIEDIKPYLRPMSSMTEEEKKEFSIFTGKTETYVHQICLDADSMANPISGGYKCVYWSLFDKCIDWLLTHHFDYCGLIDNGLALEAPKDMYKTV